MADVDELHEAARRNRSVFEDVLGAHVRLKLDGALNRQARAGWFDASGCVWCLFDDEAFVRSGTQARERRDAEGEAFDLQVFWSIEDVVMPGSCDDRWVAARIADEACRQLSERGFRCAREERLTEEGLHLGVAYRQRQGLARLLHRGG